MFKRFNLNYRHIFQIAATFIGTVVGAGFASGQEISQFFSHLGPKSIPGIIISSILLCYFGGLSMLISEATGSFSFELLVRRVCGQKLGSIVDGALSFFFLCSIGVMLAGAGSVFNQQWGLPYWLGILMTCMITAFTVMFKLEGIVRANTIIVPAMILFCLFTSMSAISLDGLQTTLHKFTPAKAGVSSSWLLSGILYASYNLTLGLSVLAPLGTEIRRKSTLILGSVFGGLGLGALALLLNLSILSNYPSSTNVEIPSLYVASLSSMFKILQGCFSIIIWAEIYTTIISNVFGLSLRISSATGLNYMKSVLLLLIIAIVLSKVGFSNLLSVLYPLFGFVSVIFLGCLAHYHFKKFFVR